MKDSSKTKQALTEELISLRQRIAELEQAHSERKRTEEALRASEKKYRFLAEKMTEIVWIQDMNLRTVYVSPSIEAVLGFSPEERLAQDVHEQLTPASMSIALDVLAKELALEQRGQADPERKIIIALEYYHKDGSSRWIENIVSGIRDNRGVLTGLHGVSRDITDRKRTEDNLRKSEEQQRLMLEKLPIAIVVDVRGKIVYVNSALLTLLKASSKDEVIGMRLIDFVSPQLYDAIEERRRMMTDEKISLPPLEVNIRRNDGVVITVVGTPMPITFDEQPAILTALYDITERKRNEIELQKANKLLEIHSKEIEDLHAKLNEQVTRDPLTGLFNRRYLEATIGRELARASRGGYPVGIVMIDIDHFKQVNDTQGHKVGDLILQTLGNFLIGRTRAGDIACRYGGDEFLLILPQASKAMTAERAEQWRTDFEALKTVYDEKILQTTISLGVAVYPRNGITTEAVIHEADQAMYRAKTSGRNRVVLA